MFTTPVILPKYELKINHQNRGLALGSCFAQEIGSRLVQRKFPLLLNPNGILFNPASIAQAFNDLTTHKVTSDHELVHHRGLWHSLHHHGSFSREEPKEILELINQPHPTDFQYILLTLGTAWVYERQGQVVANCHKLPKEEFTRRRMSTEECFRMLEPLAQTGHRIVLTVSPVKHAADGLSENNLSKSTLRVAAAELSERYPNVEYFPAYEIVTDELRDYRFYADDMLHPSAQAIEYVWQRFTEAFFSKETQLIEKRVTALLANLAHRPLHPQTAEYQHFRAQTIARAEELMALHPELDFSHEIAYF